MNKQPIKITLKTIHADLLRIEKLLIPKITGILNKKEDWFIIKDDGKKTSEILKDCRELFPVWSFFSDEVLDKEFPPITSIHKFRKRIEADEELSNLSANDLDKKGIRGITLRERLLLEISYFKETGKHLDIENVTLCSGSRYSDGDVPYVYWSDDELRVFWFFPASADPLLRSRQQFPL